MYYFLPNLLPRCQHSIIYFKYFSFSFVISVVFYCPPVLFKRYFVLVFLSNMSVRPSIRLPLLLSVIASYLHICLYLPSYLHMIYLLTAVGLSPACSITVHIYAQTIHRTTQTATNLEEYGPYPVFANFTLAFALQLRKKHGKTSVRVRKTSVRVRKTSVRVRKTSVRVRKTSVRVRKTSVRVRKTSARVRNPQSG